MPPPRITVIGGGVVGLASALELARRGAAVTVLERNPEAGREASWAGAGIVPPGNPERVAHPVERLRAFSVSLFPAWCDRLREESGVDPEFRVCGGVEFLDEADARDLPPRWAAEGIPFRRLSRCEVAYTEEELGRYEGTPFLLPTLAQVRNPRLLRALVGACARYGVSIRTDQRATVADARASADAVVVAAGAWSAELLRPLGVTLPVAPVLGRMALFRVPEPPLQRVLLAGKRYVVPRADGRVLAGSTEEPEAGFDTTVTEDGTAELVEFARTLVPILGRTELERTWAGLRPGSADGWPYVGPVPGAAGVFVAAGHYRAGIQLAPGTARLVADLVLGTTPAIAATPFAVGRVPIAPFQAAFRS